MSPFIRSYNSEDEHEECVDIGRVKKACGSGEIDFHSQLPPAN